MECAFTCTNTCMQSQYGIVTMPQGHVVLALCGVNEHKVLNVIRKPG